MPESPLARDLIKTAELLLGATVNEPSQADLRRAISTTYYALFHCLCFSCADCIIGQGTDYPKAAWRRAYRSLNHRQAKSACDHKNQRMRDILEKFPSDIQDFALQFYNMQIHRHSADYDPYFSTSKSEVDSHIKAVKSAIAGFEASPLIDRRAFATLVLFERR